MIHPMEHNSDDSPTAEELVADEIRPTVVLVKR
jgi:hypothetical protein